jgi:glycosyltransferase involved in cell wall biosynthesis
MQYPLISIILPTFNRESLTKRAVNSVIRQSYPNWELILVDDGSTEDNWRALVTTLPNWKQSLVSFSGDQKSIQLYQIDHSGVSFARNFAIKKTNGEWICFLDSDDEWLPEKLKTQFEFHRYHPEFLFSQTRELWNKNGNVRHPLGKHKKISGRYLKESLNLCLVTVSSFMAKSNALKRFDGFRQELQTCEDYDLWNRIFLNGESIALIDEDLLVRYGGHSDQLSMKYSAMERFRLYSLLLSREESLVAGHWFQVNEEDRELWDSAIRKRLGVLIRGKSKRGKSVTSLQKLEHSLANNEILPRESLEELISDTYN